MFKKVNHSHGHEVGDKVLRAIAERLQSSVRAEDTVGHQGGDEFVYLLLDLEKENHVENIAKKIRKTIAATCEIEGIPFTVQASIGIAIYAQDGLTPEELLKSADIAMYKAKEKRQGTVSLARSPRHKRDQHLSVLPAIVRNKRTSWRARL